MRSLRGIARLTIWGALLPGLAGAGPARADEAAPNVITVRPSGVDPRITEALTAEERLERRLKRSAEMLRSICVGCGRGDAVAGAAPFSPMDALRAGAAPSQMLVQQALPDQIVVEVREVEVGQVEVGPAATSPATAPEAPTDAAPSPAAVRR